MRGEQIGTPAISQSLPGPVEIAVERPLQALQFLLRLDDLLPGQYRVLT